MLGSDCGTTWCLYRGDRNTRTWRADDMYSTVTSVPSQSRQVSSLDWVFYDWDAHLDEVAHRFGWLQLTVRKQDGAGGRGSRSEISVGEIPLIFSRTSTRQQLLTEIEKNLPEYGLYLRSIEPSMNSM
jgi:hypothetical protein